MKNRYTLHSFFDDPPLTTRTCERLGCHEVGGYPAPKSPSRLREYYWFCLEHVREYNLNWDYYKRMSQEEIERNRQHDATWQRPTWKFGHNGASFKNLNTSDPFNFFSEQKASRRPYSESAWFPPYGEEAQALKVLGLTMPLTGEDLKKRYKELAKKYHPDINSGCASSEEQLKKINQAYTVLKKLMR